MPAVTKFCPRVSYPGGSGGATITWTAAFPQRPWEPESAGKGGWRESAASVPHSYRIHRTEQLHARLRFYEWEWPAVRAWLAWAQDNGSTPFTFRLDQDDPATEYTVYLVKPVLPEPLHPKREQYLGQFALDVVLRSTTAQSMHVEGWNPVLVNVASIDVTPATLDLRV